MGKVKYIGAAVPTVFNVVAGSEQQIIEVRKAGEVFTFSNAIATALVTTLPGSWEAAEGWEPPPYEPPEAEVLTLTSEYTLGLRCKKILANAQAAGFPIKLPSAVGLEGKEFTIINGATNNNIVKLESLGGNILAPNAEASNGQPSAQVLELGKTKLYSTVTVTAIGGNWHVG